MLMVMKLMAGKVEVNVGESKVYNRFSQEPTPLAFACLVMCIERIAMYGRAQEFYVHGQNTIL